MKDGPVVLVCQEDSVAKFVTEACAQVAGARVQFVPTFTGHEKTLDEATLVLSSLGSQQDADQTEKWLKQVMVSKKACATLLICDHERNDLALPLLRMGATDCLNRPLDLSRLVYLIDILTMRARLAAAEAKASPAPNSVQYLGGDRSFLFLPDTPGGEIVDQIFRVAPQAVSILIQGETGTGKTRLARLIHDLSPRRDEPFQVVNCAALSANVIESEMFGHVKGAFTGADRDRTGKFAAAEAGTIFLDDLNALPLELQAKLLRVVEDRAFEPVGSNHTLPMRARVIVASNANLSDEVAAGRFRADLYYRLCVVAFFVPPLRENLALVPGLAAKFLNDYRSYKSRPLRGISPTAMEVLQDHDWPGNIRELRNVIERAVALSRGDTVELDDLPPELRPASVQAKLVAKRPAVKPARESNQLSTGAEQASTLADAKQTAEAIHIADALARNKNNRLRAALELGISRMTLYNKMHLYGLLGGSAPA